MNAIKSKDNDLLIYSRDLIYQSADEMTAESEGRTQHKNQAVWDMLADADKKYGKIKEGDWWGPK